MSNNNQTENPFITFGTPNLVVINGVQASGDIFVAFLQELSKRPNEVIAFRLSRIDGFVKLIAVTY